MQRLHGTVKLSKVSLYLSILYKVSATIKDSLDNRLKREGLVEDHGMKKEQDEKKYLKVAHYTITPKGQKLLRGWLVFYLLFNNDI
jgi:DNA-binding PadR family transcriptional regulator